MMCVYEMGPFELIVTDRNECFKVIDKGQYTYISSEPNAIGLSARMSILYLYEKYILFIYIYFVE